MGYFVKMIEDFRIRVFLTVVSEGGFKKAADVLGISQSAVSQRIADLEKDLGVKLFTRNRLVGSHLSPDPQADSDHAAEKPYISLSEAGELFMPFAEKIAATYSEASSLFTPHRSSKPIRIATTSLASNSILPPVLKTLSATTGAAFITDIFPEGTDFEALVGTASARPTLTDAQAFAVWTSFEPGLGLVVHAAATRGLRESPLYRTLRHFLGR